MKNELAFYYRALRYRYRVDPQEIQFLSKNLKRGEVAVDIGCHKGAYLYWMKRAVGAKGRVWGFEPQRKLYDYLQEHVGHKPGITIEHLGVSDQPGELSLQVPISKRGTSPGASFSAPNLGESRVEQVQVVTLDNYFAELDQPIRFLKIDVEGHELSVLKGAQQILSQHHPTILMECENRHLAQGSVADVFGYLLDLGYQGQFFGGNGLQPLAEFDAAMHQQQGEGRFWEAAGYVNNFAFHQPKLI